MTPEETQNRFDVGAKAFELAEQRERRYFQKVLSAMTPEFLVETMRDMAGKLEPKAADLVLEAASRVEGYAKIYGRTP